MSENERFIVNYEEFTENDLIPCGIYDKKERKLIVKIEEVCKKLNKQHDTIEELQNEIKNKDKIIELYYAMCELLKN